MKLDIESINNKLIASVVIVMFLVIGGVYGYSVALLEQARQTSNFAELTNAPSEQVLGTGISPYYVNPLKSVNVKEVAFPVAQLRGCRNYEECKNYCDVELNYQACSSWSHSIE
jgi:hypothetical protein